MNPTGSKKKAIVFTLFILIVLPLLVFVVGKQVRMRSKAGFGVDPRASQPSTLIFPTVPLYSFSGDVNAEQYRDNLVLQNIYSDKSSVKVTLNTPNGKVEWEESYSLPAFGQREVNLPILKTGAAVMPFGIYTITVSADRGIRGVLNVMQTGGGSFASDSYTGFFPSEKSKKWFFPTYLRGKGMGQDDLLTASIVSYNDASDPVAYSARVYTPEGYTLKIEQRTIAPNSVDVFSSVVNRENAYGSIVIEAANNVYSQLYLKSDKRISFAKGQINGKDQWIVPFPFNSDGKNCSTEYTDGKPYCGEAKLLVLNPNTMPVKVNVADLKSDNSLPGLPVLPRTLMSHEVAVFPIGSAKKITTINGQVMAAVVFESKVYWDTMFALSEPLKQQFLPFWSKGSMPFSTTTGLEVFNGNDSNVDLMVDYFDQFGQIIDGEQKVMAPYERLHLIRYWQTGSQYGSARVTGVYRGDKSTSGQAPLFSYVVGSQEVRDSSGNMLAGDGAFTYFGVGYDIFETPPSTPIADNVLHSGWNKPKGGINFKIADCSVETNKLGGRWNAISYQTQGNDTAKLYARSFPDDSYYIHCGTGTNSFPTPIGSPINTTMPIPTGIVKPAVVLDRSYSRCGDLDSAAGETGQSSSSAGFGVEGVGIRFSGVIQGISPCDKISANLELGLTQENNQRQVKVNIVNLGHQGVCIECVAQNSFSGVVNGLESGSYYFSLVYKGASVVEGKVELP